eukprot:104028-Chlamydomonas_euryale.AAC.2
MSPRGIRGRVSRGRCPPGQHASVCVCQAWRLMRAWRVRCAGRVRRVWQVSRALRVRCAWRATPTPA